MVRPAQETPGGRAVGCGGASRALMPSCQETLNFISAAEEIEPKLPRTGQSS